jgi:hypothetical protein
VVKVASDTGWLGSGASVLYSPLPSQYERYERPP